MLDQPEAEMMSEHERWVLRHPRIVEFHKFYSEYHVFFDVGEDSCRVSFRVYETGDHRFFFEQSHFIRTPLQGADSVTPRQTHTEPHLALESGVHSITTYYEEAVTHGHPPELAWFVRNNLY